MVRRRLTEASPAAHLARIADATHSDATDRRALLQAGARAAGAAPRLVRGGQALAQLRQLARKGRVFRERLP
jgi:hypothetical protein